MLFPRERHVAFLVLGGGIVSSVPEVWPAFDWADPLLLDSSLREDERLVRDSARSFAQSRLMPLVRDMHRHESFDPGLLREMGTLGLLGSTLPEFGGASPVAYGLIAREVERVDSAFRSSLVGAIQPGDASHPCLWQYGAAGKIPAAAGVGRMDRLPSA